MDYITRLRNMLIIQSIVLSIRSLTFIINFTYIWREYLSLVIIQNFFITIGKLMLDFYYLTISIFYPEVLHGGQNRIFYLTQDTFHKFITFSFTISHQILNLLIYLFIFISNSYLMSIGLYYDELTLQNYYNNSTYILPTLYSIEDYNNLVFISSEENIHDFFNFILMFSSLYPILSSINFNNDQVLNKFKIIEGMPIPENEISDDTLCSICWDNKCDWVLHCKHKYHLKCIEKWHINNNKNTCPYCRCLIKKIT